MAIERREQVFVSSTFLDLRDERQAIIQTLLEADCFPAGMELFPASDDEKWELIRDVIDDSDYYVVVLGGRYGSVDSDGIGYTEKEFDYAVESGKPVMGFVHGDPASIPAGKTELKEDAQERLRLFKEKVEKRMVKYWTSPEELSGALAVSLIKTRKRHPAVGWVRGNHVMSPEVETEIAQLRERVASLTQQLESRQSGGPAEGAADPVDLAQGDDQYPLRARIKWWKKGESASESNAHRDDVEILATWDTIFAQVAPRMVDECAEASLEKELLHVLSDWLIADTVSKRPTGIARFSGDITLDREAMKDITVQFFALGLIRKSDKRHPVSDAASYWTLTERGRAHMMNLRALRRNAQPSPSLESAPRSVDEHGEADTE